MNWELANQISGTIQNVAAAIAVIGGAAWGYFRFIRFRTLKPRLDFSFHWSCSEGEGPRSVGIVTIKLSNRGNTKIDLRKDQRPRCFLKYALLTDGVADEELSLLSLPSERLEHLDVAFAAHKWIEPGETIDDVKALYIQKAGVVAVQFEVVIFGPQKWSASAAFPLVRTESSMSEDEQDTYEEWQAAKEELKSSLTRAKRTLSRRSGDDKAGLEGVIEEAASLLTRLSTGPVSDHLLSEVKRVSEKLDKYSR